MRNNRRSNYRKKSSPGKRIASSIIYLLLVMVIIGVAGYGYLNSTIAGFTSTGKVNKANDIAASNPKYNSPVNILVLGADYVEGETKDFSKRRTDTMMVVNYNPTTKKVLGVSIPRDTKVTYKGKNAKINSINEYGGPRLSVPTVENLLGITINYYVILDYQGFNAIVDSIGGVTVTIPHRMKYDDPVQNLHIDFKKGDTVKLDGKKAEEFFRWRKNNAGIPTDTIDAGGDLGRIENQRVLISAIADKVSSPTMLTKIPSLLKTSSQYVATNMSADDIKHYGLALVSVGASNIKFSTLKGEVPEKNNPQWYFEYNPSINGEILTALNGKIVLNREDLKVKILNGTDVNGLAAKLKKELVENKKYSDYNVEVGTIKEGYTQSVIEAYNIDKSLDNTILSDFQSTGITNIKHLEDDSSKSSIIVRFGKDLYGNNK